jgi:hypothetical protein
MKKCHGNTGDTEKEALKNEEKGICKGEHPISSGRTDECLP